MALLPSMLCIDLAATAALFAQLSHARRRDPVVCRPCARIATWLLIAGSGFLIVHRAISADYIQSNEAARQRRAALVSLHAPVSLEALARDRVHRRVDLLARDDR